MHRPIKFRIYDASTNTMGIYDLFDIWRNATPNPSGVGMKVMQYTGLHDRNGKEIYEGDVVNIFTQNLKEATYKEVIQIPTCYTLFSLGECEVIGNIYENPDLLK